MDLRTCSPRVWVLSGGFEPCRHLRPPSGREHTVVLLIQSGDDDYLMIELGGNLPQGHDARLFSICGTGSCIDVCPVAQTRLDIPRPLFTQSWTTGGKPKCSGTRQIRTADLSVHSRTRQPPDHDDCAKSEDRVYPGSSTGGGGDLLPIGAPPRVGHSQGVSPRRRHHLTLSF